MMIKITRLLNRLCRQGLRIIKATKRVPAYFLIATSEPFLNNLLKLSQLLKLQMTTVDRFVSIFDKWNAVRHMGNIYAPVGTGDGIIKASPWGFFSNFFAVLGLLDWCEKKGKIPIVLFDSGAYFDPAYGPNWWEYYFERICSADLHVVNPYPAASHQELWENRLSYFARDRLSLSRKHKLVKKYVKIKPHILEKINHFMLKEFSGHYMVGVHLRGTDKPVREGASCLPIDFIKKQIDNVVKNKPSYKIFLATEDQDYSSQMQVLYKDHLVLRDSTRLREKAVHACKEYHGYKIGEDVLIDCLLLSKCNYLLASISNVSHCALVFNPKMKYKNIMILYSNKCLNFIASSFRSRA
jgi:hypothetical protein